MIALAETLGLESYSLVGHSMGGRIGLRAARQKPPGLKRLVMLDPPVSGPGRRAYPAKLPWYVDSIQQSLVGMDADAMRVFCPTWTEEQLQLRAEWLHTCDERAVLESFDGFHTDDFHGDAPHVEIPTLLVRAERGDVVLDEDETELKSLMPNLVSALVPNAGHMIPWDNEDGLYEALGDFLGVRIP